MSNIAEYQGFKDLASMLEYYAKNADNILEVLETGAREFVSDLLKLPKPISKIRKSGYTHLVNSFAYRKKKKEIEVGWGKYYGPMVEHGTEKMDANPHVYPLWDKSKEKYYKTMLTKLGLQAW